MATGFINRLYGQELKEVKQTSRQQQTLTYLFCSNCTCLNTTSEKSCEGLTEAATQNIDVGYLAQGSSLDSGEFTTIAGSKAGLRLSQGYALRKAYTKAGTNGRVTEGQLCCCFWSIGRNISSALPKGIPLPYLSQMPQIRSLLFKMPAGTEIHSKYSLEFTIIFCKLKNIFFPGDNILEC